SASSRGLYLLRLSGGLGGRHGGNPRALGEHVPHHSYFALARFDQARQQQGVFPLFDGRAGESLAIGRGGGGVLGETPVHGREVEYVPVGRDVSLESSGFEIGGVSAVDLSERGVGGGE